MNVNKGSNLVCSICHKALVNVPNNEGFPYALHDKAPVICNECVEKMYNNMLLFEELFYEDKEKTAEKKREQEFEMMVVKPNQNSISVLDTISLPGEKGLDQIIRNVKDVVIGQDEHVENIATTIFKNYLFRISEVKSNIILIGKTGTGKTKIMKMIAQQYDIPCVIVDATQFTEAGYVGRDVTSMLTDLLEKANNNLENAQRGILVIDEGDKKGAYSNGNERDVSGESVQFALLKILEGSIITIAERGSNRKLTFDTRFLTIVYVGAFQRVYQARDNRINKIHYGFEDPSAENGKKDFKFISEDFLEGGFSKEFLGRFDFIEELNELEINELVSIITKSKDSPLLYYKYMLLKLGVKVLISNQVIKNIAQAAYEYNTGARALKSIITKMFLRIMNEVMTSEGKYSKVIIYPDIVNDNSKYKLIS